jgi:hypothetical protein
MELEGNGNDTPVKVVPKSTETRISGLSITSLTSLLPQDEVLFAGRALRSAGYRNLFN